MTLPEAIDLIRDAVQPDDDTPKVWSDLGCGSGTFTYALSHLLPPNSRIIAVDQVDQALKPEVNGVRIEFRQLDFSASLKSLPQVDGLLIANALHYIKQKSPLLAEMQSLLSSGGRLVIIEYDTLQSNRWVPYPVTLIELEKILAGIGFSKTKKTMERPSVYGDFNMYVMVADK
jgi:ubiquinone/menaquinone biosynthesis C-methylase UbiE